jgi:hypothetical protein
MRFHRFHFIDALFGDQLFLLHRFFRGINSTSVDLEMALSIVEFMVDGKRSVPLFFRQVAVDHLQVGHLTGGLFIGQQWLILIDRMQTERTGGT